MNGAPEAGVRFYETVEETTHVALYIRDTLDLIVPTGPDVPPPLLGRVPNQSMSMRLDRQEAGSEWLTWWRAVVQRQIRAHSTENHAAELHGSDPRQDWPQGRLGDAIALLYEEACLWAEGPRRAAHPPLGEFAFPWKLVQEVAETQGGLQRSPGLALVLSVRGVWWTPIQPQTVLCSRAAADDVVQCRELLKYALTTPTSSSG